jgi:arabinose-5-phosphate isomerase
MNILDKAKEVLDIESDAILNLKSGLGDEFLKALEFIVGCTGKVIITGIGKSGIIARKMASTMSSTGTPALFLHAAESSHGDLGVISKSDLVIGISFGGESAELEDLLKFIKRTGVKLISITGNLQSRLAQAGDVVLHVPIKKEACPLGLAPTSSTTATLAMCDAVAMCALEMKGFQVKDFAEYHPGGKLGRKLLTRVSDVMMTEALPIVNESASFKEVLDLMTQAQVRGICGVVNKDQELLGVVTDGDLRRKLNTEIDLGSVSSSLKSLTAKDIMSSNPKTLDKSELAEKALFLMEQFRIQCLFVMDREGTNSLKPVGLIHLQDLLAAKIR